jgi:hypothetical protein
MAAGEDVTREARDVLTDVRKIYNPGERGLHWQQIAVLPDYKGVGILRGASDVTPPAH